MRKGAKDLYDSSPVWKNFFRKKYQGPLDLLADIPKKSTYSLATVVTYYLSFYPNIKSQRRWIDTARAIDLSGGNPEWKNFFTKDFKGPKDLLANIPSDSTHSKATMASYYLALNPGVKHYRRWINLASAVALSESSQKWKNFFAGKFKNLDHLIKNLPNEYYQSKATIVGYYLALNPDTENKRHWANAICAIILSENNEEWRDFFEINFSSTSDLLANIPEGSKLSPAMTLTYYLIFHPEIRNKRNWSNTVCAIILSEKKNWKKFFKTVYKHPKDLLASIPIGATQSKATLVGYYLFFHPKIVNGRDWLRAICGYIFCQKNPEAGRLLINRKLDAKSAIEEYNLKQSPATIEAYFSALRRHDFKERDIFKA